MKIFPLFLAAAFFLSAPPTQAQELFLKKGANTPPPAQGTEEAPRKAAPLFLKTPSSSSSSAGASKKTNAGKPLFLDGTPGSSGSLYKPAQKNARIFDLTRKAPDALSREQKLDIAMEETRLANIRNIQQESARLQAETQSALSKWRAETQAAAAAEAALAVPPPAAQTPVQQIRKTAPAKSIRRTEEESKPALPKPVFNTQR